jgi:hypothetical protein
VSVVLCHSWFSVGQGFFAYVNFNRKLAHEIQTTSHSTTIIIITIITIMQQYSVVITVYHTNFIQNKAQKKGFLY